VWEWRRYSIQYNTAEMSGLWNFSVQVQFWSNKIESEPVLILKIFENPIQSWAAHVKSWIFILPHEAKASLELFCLQPNMTGWRQNSCSMAFASWGKIDIAFWHFQYLTRQCLLCLMNQKHCWSYFAIRRIRFFELFKWQGRYRIHLD